MGLAVLPAAEDLDPALVSDASWAASKLGSQVAELAAVSALRGRDRPRAAFCITLADGRKLKLRRLPGPERAAELARLTERLRDLGIPQVVLRRGGALVEEWIDGAPLLESAGQRERIEEAARLLARIHETPSFGGLALPVLRPTEPALLAMREEISLLVREERLATDTAGRLLALARERAPGRALQGIVHGDFCAENFVVDADERLRVVDNEGLELGFLALDLSRVWSRWPMPEAAWNEFLAVYRSSPGRHTPGEDLLFWKIRTLVRSAWYRVTERLGGADGALARLRRLLDGV